MTATSPPRCQPGDVVELDPVTAQAALDLLTCADELGAFGKCDDQPDADGFCRVCTTLGDLQTAIFDAQDRASFGQPTVPARAPDAGGAS